MRYRFTTGEIDELEERGIIEDLWTRVVELEDGGWEAKLSGPEATKITAITGKLPHRMR